MSSSKMLLSKQEINALDKRTLCDVCKQPLKSSNISSPFDLIKCPENNEHVFHSKCFHEIDPNSPKCPICSCECLNSVNAFLNLIRNALLEKENVLVTFSNLLFWSNNDVSCSYINWLFADVDFSYFQIKQIIANLEPFSGKDEKISEYCNILSNFSKKEKYLNFQRMSCTKESCLKDIMMTWMHFIQFCSSVISHLFINLTILNYLNLFNRSVSTMMK